MSIKVQVRWLQGNNGVLHFLWCFVYLIFIISFKIRCVNRLPLLDSLWLNLGRAHAGFVMITDIALRVFGLSPAPMSAGSRHVYCESFGHEQYHN